MNWGSPPTKTTDMTELFTQEEWDQYYEEYCDLMSDVVNEEFEQILRDPSTYDDESNLR